MISVSWCSSVNDGVGAGSPAAVVAGAAAADGGGDGCFVAPAAAA